MQFQCIRWLRSHMRKGAKRHQGRHDIVARVPLKDVWRDTKDRTGDAWKPYESRMEAVRESHESRMKDARIK